MARGHKLLNRRDVLRGGAWLAAGVAAAGTPFDLWAADSSVLNVAYAGSMGSMMEGAIKTAVAKSLKLEMHGLGQASNALAQLIVKGSIRPDVFLPVTPGPMLTVLQAGKAETARPVAHTEMVIAYSPKSRFAPLFRAAASGKELWWKILMEPGLRFGRTDPVTDPQGRNIIFAMMLAAKFYKQPNLVDAILGPSINEKQIFSEPTVQVRLQIGELDAASAYKIQPGPFNVPYITLPKQVNLSSENIQKEHPDISLALNGKTYNPEPLIYYAAALTDAVNSAGAHSFLRWLAGPEAQAIFHKFEYDPPGNATALHP